MNNVFTRLPKRGDLEIRRISDRKRFYITAETLSYTEINQNVYEIIGPVICVKGDKVLVAYKLNASRTWADRYSYKLSGYTLDGQNRTGVISIRENSSASQNTDYTVSYKANNLVELANQLNTFFQANATFRTQDWYAEVNGTEISVHYAYTFWQQAYNTAKSGFSFAVNLLPDIASLADIVRRHGGSGGEGAISSIERALAYFRTDNSSTTYNPASDVTNIKTTYPICLPGYLGTSQYQSDHCAKLRQVYGEGEKGWLKYMASCLPVVDIDYGNFGQQFGRLMTQLLASKTYKSSTKNAEPLCKAAVYCNSIQGQTIDRGEFYLPTVEEVYKILDGVKYGTQSSRTADVVNATLYKIGGNAISNGSNLWSCCRCYAYGAWFAYGSYGFFGSNYFCSSLLCVPVSLHEL